MSKTEEKIATLMNAGCPVDLNKPEELYKALDARLGGNGRWTIKKTEEALPGFFRDSKLASDLQTALKPGYVAKTTENLEHLFWGHVATDDIMRMSETMGVEFITNWTIFPCSNHHSKTVWIVEGSLSTGHFGQNKGWVVYAEVSEIFPENLLNVA